MHPESGTESWLSKVQEEVIEPERPIIDPHHHLWRRQGSDYLLEELWQDTTSGHKITQTVFVECGAEYLQEGPAYERSLGETTFVAEEAERSRSNNECATISGIVGHVDLRLGGRLEHLLRKHQEAGRGLFRGIRHAGAHALYPETLTIAGRAPKDLYADSDYRAGVRMLGDLDLTFDTWHYHYQNKAFIDLALECPETVMILDHFGTPLGVGPFAGQREQIFGEWQRDMETLAENCPNVVAKLGGLAMPDNGFGWSERDHPASSDEFVEAQARYYHHMIECFGPGRCMLESNFPVDKFSIGYHTLYNAFKKIVGEYSESDQDLMFSQTAATIYGLAV